MSPASPTGLCLTALAVALAVGAAPGQSGRDLRDGVTLTDGSVVEGRLATPFAGGDLLVLDGGKRTRVRREKVQSTDTVALHVATFFERRLRHRRLRHAVFN